MLVGMCLRNFLEMNVKHQFSDYVIETNTPGSNKADSYIRAIGYANTMLQSRGCKFQGVGDIFSIDSIDQLKRLHQFFCDEASKGESSSLLSANIPSSYLTNNFCSAALRALIGYRLTVARDAEILRTLEETGRPDIVEAAIEKVPFPNPEFFLEGNTKVDSAKGANELERLRGIQNRRIFRKIVFNNFNDACCVSGLDVADTLRACPIIPGRQQFSPENALCLAATYAAAFKRHLITFDEDFRLVLSASLSEHSTGDAFRHTFKAYEGQRMLPARFIQPSEKLMQKHRNLLVA